MGLNLGPRMIRSPNRSVGSCVVVIAIATVASLNACTSATPASTGARGSTPPQPSLASLAPGTGAAAGSVMQVNIRSGKDLGSHYAFARDTKCTYGLAAQGANKADSGGIDYSGGGNDLSAMTVVIPKGTEAKAGDGSPSFLFDATVHGTHYVIDTHNAPLVGAGLAKLIDYGKSGIISIGGRTTVGTSLDPTIQCNAINGR